MQCRAWKRLNGWGFFAFEFNKAIGCMIGLLDLNLNKDMLFGFEFKQQLDNYLLAEFKFEFESKQANRHPTRVLASRPTEAASTRQY